MKVASEEDTIATLSEGGEREPFFSYLAESILGAGRLVLIICANVIAIAALLKCVNVLLGLLHASLSLELILGVVLFPFAWLLGLAPAEAFQIAQYMGTKSSRTNLSSCCRFRRWFRRGRRTCRL